MRPEMNHREPVERDPLRVALGILQWALGLVILAKSARFAFSSDASLAFAKAGMPNFIHPALAWAEIAAAVLFMVPRATLLGAKLLIAVLSAAIVIHLLHEWFDVGALFVYAAAAWAVAAGKRTALSEQA
jgi:hypothetical protein